MNIEAAPDDVLRATQMLLHRTLGELATVSAALEAARRKNEMLEKAISKMAESKGRENEPAS